MKAEVFFEKFDQLTEAPNAMRKWRELVLQLAVSGKLVEQNPAEGNADDLLKEIAMARVVQKREKENGETTENPIAEGDYWHGVPGSWRWVRLGTLGAIIGGGTPRSDNASYFADDGIPWLTPADLNGYKEKRISRGRRCITQLGLENSSAQLLPAGSILFSSRAPIGYVAIAGRELATNQGFKSCVPYVVETNEYLYYFLRSAAARIDQEASGTTFREVSGKIVSQIPVPLPPLAEQKRIVVKVDELMDLCDRLEAQQQERDTRHAALARASLARFAEAPTPANLDFLFHSSYTITPADLRKSILTLAVQGKLVPQDPTEGDARKMIDLAMETRQQTIKKKSLRRKDLDESSDLFEHEDLPSSWCVERIANLVDPENTISYGVLVPGNDVPDGIPFVRAQDLSLSNHPARPNKTISPDIEKPYARTRLTGGEILLCVVGSIGKLGVVPDSWAGANIARAVARIKPIPDVLRGYLLLVLQEHSVQNYFTLTTRTLAQPTLNVGMIEQTPIPIPPLAEQHRIVTKVDQLMALVDHLETQLTATRATAAKLMEAVVAELTASAPSSPTNSSVTHRTKSEKRAHAH